VGKSFALARRWAPWLVAGAALALLFLRYPPATVAAEMASGDAVAAAPWVAMVVVLAIASMSVADWLLFAAALGARIGLLDVLRGRAGTAILTTLHYGVSVGGYGVWLARRSGAGAARATGSLVFQMLSDLCALYWFALAATVAGGDFLPQRTAITLVAATGAVGLTAVLLLAPHLGPRRLRDSRFLAAWRDIGPARMAASTLLRIVTVVINIAGTWLAARAFGLDIPLSAMAAGLPVIYIVGALPVNVLGFGAVSAAWVAVFAPFATGAELLAFQFVYQLLSTALTVLRGLPFLPSVIRDLAPPGPAAT
jgi:hypothetical protein